MDDLERRLRDSFRERAGDLETTPQLWDRVKDRIGAQQRRRWYATAAWAAAAAIVLLGAGIVVAQVVDRQADAPPVIDTSPGPTPLSGNVPPFVIATDGRAAAIVQTATGEGQEFNLGANAQRLQGLAVRPGSTADDFDVAYVTEPSATEAGYVAVRDGQVRRSEHFSNPEVEGSCEDPETFAMSGPVWAPDGSGLAWFGFCDQGTRTSTYLRLEGWSDGDTTASPDRGATYDQFDLGLGGEVTDIRLRDWVGTPDGASDASGELRLTAVVDGRPVAVTLPTGGPETPLDVDIDAPRIVPAEAFDGSFPLTWRSVPGDDGAPAVEYALTAPQGDEDEAPGRVELRRRSVDESQRLPWQVVDVPHEILRIDDTAAAKDLSLVVRDRSVLLTTPGGDVWAYDVDSERFFGVPVVPLETAIVAADFLGAADTDPPPQPTPTETAASPTPEPSPTGALDGAGPALVTDGTSFAIARNGSTEDALYTLDEEGESTVVALAVRPGSTPDDLTAAVLTQAEGMYDLRHFRYVDGETSFEVFADPYRLREPTLDGPVPTPVWSPDGRHLAWLESSPDGPVLRTIGWDDGPGTGRTADDNADFLLDAAPVDAQPALEEWVWRSAPDPEASGMIQAVDRELRLYTVDVTRQADGALAVADTRVTEGPGPGGGALVDLADSHAATDETSARYLLTAVGSGEGGVDLRLTVVAADDQGDDLAVPDELTRTSDPSSVWMTAHGDGVLLGAGGQAWRVAVGADTPDPLEGTVWYADFVR